MGIKKGFWSWTSQVYYGFYSGLLWFTQLVTFQFLGSSSLMRLSPCARRSRGSSEPCTQTWWPGWEGAPGKGLDSNYVHHKMGMINIDSPWFTMIPCGSIHHCDLSQRTIIWCVGNPSQLPWVAMGHHHHEEWVGQKQNKAIWNHQDPHLHNHTLW